MLVSSCSRKQPSTNDRWRVDGSVSQLLCHLLPRWRDRCVLHCPLRSWQGRATVPPGLYWLRSSLLHLPTSLPGFPRGSLQITCLHLKLCLRLSFWKNPNEDNLFSILLDIFPHMSKTEAKSFQSKPWLMPREAEGLTPAAW